MTKTKFPVLATLLLIFGIVWLVNVIGFANISLPWLPVILIVVAIAMIANRYR
ncbi:MAG: hypothetical protein PVJ67_00455 [Candidatus Pacearchaeota archaeon]|jgi:hypothetical protein